MRVFFTYLVCLPLAAFSQITITNPDLPSGAGTFSVGVAMTAPGFQANSTGPNHNWNFSNLQATSTENEAYVAVISTPFAYQFLFNNPFDSQYQSTHAAPTEGFEDFEGFSITDIYTYYKNTSSDYRITGMGVTLNGIPLAGKSEPVDKVFEFPLQFNNQSSANTTLEIGVPGFLEYKMKQNRSTTVDGWGSITTPAGTFDVLRVKTVLEITDSLAVNFEGTEFAQEIPRPQSTEYRWMANGYKVPILFITETTGFVSSVRFYNGPVGVKELETEKEFTLYPNPAADFVRIAGLSIGREYRITDLTGRTVLTGRYEGQINTESLPAGTFQVIIPGDGNARTLPFVKQ
jgi:hypothetical protein